MSRFYIVWRFLAVLSVFVATSVDGGDLLLVDSGKPVSTIVLDSGASASEQWAAKELQSHIEQISGITLAITTAEKAKLLASENQSLIIVGYHTLAKMHPEIKLAGLGSDGFIIKTEGNHLILAGGQLRGSMYAVFTFLESLGCRWWTPSESSIPKMSTVAVGPRNIREIPRYEYRDMLYNDFEDEAGIIWGARNKLNGMAYKTVDPKYGGRIEYEGNIVHSFRRLMVGSGGDAEAHLKAHPEQWALRDGVRQTTQPCLTNPEVYETMTNSVLERYRKNPDDAFVVVGQNDNRSYCQCENCVAITKREGSAAGPPIALANRIAEFVEKHHDGARIMTPAYEWSRKPPATIRPRDNVLISLCSIECDFAHPLVDASTPENAKFVEDIKSWSKITSQIYIWDYTTNFRHFLMPFPNLDVIVPNVKFFADYGAIGLFNQGSHTCRGSEFAQLRMWMLAKAMWNTELDNQALISEFLEGYYGAAAPYIQQYIDVMHQPVRESLEPMRCFVYLDAYWITTETITASEIILRQAEAAVADDAVLLRRVKHAHMPIWYVLLKFGPNSTLWQDVNKKLGELPYQDVAANFNETVKAFQINQIAERESSEQFVTWVGNYADILDNQQVLPEELKNADPKTYTVIQAAQFDRNLAWLYPVDDAIDGYAINSKTNGWHVRYTLNEKYNFKAGGTYKLFARIKGSADLPDGPAVSLGLRGDGNLINKTVDGLQIKDGQFHTIEVGKVTLPDGLGYFWTALANAGVDGSFDIDCIWLQEVE